MSWITRINGIELIIITGDGKEYKPLWKDAIKNVNYNNEAFDFIGIRGTYVERKEVQGTQYPILLYFQGENCIEDSRNFEISSSDRRAWRIKHPFFDDIIAQPLNLSFDYTSLNLVKVSGALWETIEQKYPEDTLSPEKEIIVKKETTDEFTEEVFVDDIEVPSAESPQVAGQSVNAIGSEYETITEQSDDITRLKDNIRTASSAAQELILQPGRFINEVINLVNFPFTIKQDIEQKIKALLNLADKLVGVFLTNATDDNKIMYEMISSSLFTELSRNIISSTEDEYLIRQNVVDVVGLVNDSYDLFLTNLDDNEIIQNSQIGIDVDYIVNLALGKLYDIAFESKQEREYILDKDDNIINLSHRFLGPGDDNIDLLIAQNNIGINEYITMKKGRKITYYV